MLSHKGLLDARRRAAPKWVFPAPTKKALKIVHEQRAFRLGVDAEEIEFDFVPYSIRHTAITRKAEEGNSVPDLMYWAGHSNIATTMVYIHLAIEKINARGNVNKAKSDLRKGVMDFANLPKIDETVQ